MPITPSKILQTLGTLRGAARYYKAGSLAVAARVLKLYAIDGWTRIEIFHLGLADPRMPDEELAKIISTKQMHRLQLALNPRDYAYVTEDKAIFNQFRLGAGIPGPELFAVLDPAQIWLPDGRRLRRREDWPGFLLEDLPETFVVKPTSGVHCESVRVLTREGESFVEPSGRRYAAHELLRALEDDPAYDRFLFEQRLVNHPDLAALSGTGALQNTRVITVIGDDGEPQIPLAIQKLIGAGNMADNFGYGRRGNLVAALDLERGTIERAVVAHDSDFGLSAKEVHPDSGQPLVGFQVPYWPEVRAMVSAAAIRLMPIRTIGWDIAITPEGPSVIEANIYWSPDHANALRRTYRFLEVARGIERRTLQSRDF